MAVEVAVSAVVAAEEDREGEVGREGEEGDEAVGEDSKPVRE